MATVMIGRYGQGEHAPNPIPFKSPPNFKTASMIVIDVEHDDPSKGAHITFPEDIIMEVISALRELI